MMLLTHRMETPNLTSTSRAMYAKRCHLHLTYRIQHGGIIGNYGKEASRGEVGHGNRPPTCSSRKSYHCLDVVQKEYTVYNESGSVSEMVASPACWARHDGIQSAKSRLIAGWLDGEVNTHIHVSENITDHRMTETIHANPSILVSVPR